MIKRLLVTAVLCGIGAVPAAAIEKELDTEAVPGPLIERARAFSHPQKFHSTGKVEALLMKFPRDVSITLAAVKDGSELKAIQATVIDNLKEKTATGELDLSEDGSVSTSEPTLMNCTNVMSISPAIRRKLLTAEGPFEATGKMEVAGTVRDVTFAHTRVGEPADDGSMKVETKTSSEDGKVDLTTTTILAPDGLPWKASTTGILKKGPVSLNVALELVRETKDASETGE